MGFISECIDLVKMLMWLPGSEYQMDRDMFGNIFRILHQIDFGLLVNVKLIQF